MKRNPLDPPKGRIQKHLDAIRSCNKPPYTVKEKLIVRQGLGEWKVCHIRDVHGYYYISLCLRGNSKQRRQQRRAAERYLNGQTKHPSTGVGAVCMSNIPGKSGYMGFTEGVQIDVVKDRPAGPSGPIVTPGTATITGTITIGGMAANNLAKAFGLPPEQ